jgi:hypothetical protein
MCAAQLLTQFVYHMLKHEAYAPFQIFPSPVLSFIFDLAFWIFGFGYLMGEFTWRKQERDYHSHDNAACDQKGAVESGWLL